MISNSLSKLSREMKDMVELTEVIQLEADRVSNRIDEIINQLCIKTATYSLDDWEKEFGIEKNSLLTEEQRKAQLLAVLNTRTPASVPMLENLVKQTLGANSVIIKEIPSEYRFIIYVQTDYLTNMEIVKDAVKKARPAHLGFEFINGILREKTKHLYVGISGISRRMSNGEVNVDGI